jgi:hypothetical protein
MSWRQELVDWLDELCAIETSTAIDRTPKPFWRSHVVSDRSPGGEDHRDIRPAAAQCEGRHGAGDCSHGNNTGGEA